MKPPKDGFPESKKFNPCQDYYIPIASEGVDNPKKKGSLQIWGERTDRAATYRAASELEASRRPPSISYETEALGLYRGFWSDRSRSVSLPCVIERLPSGAGKPAALGFATYNDSWIPTNWEMEAQSDPFIWTDQTGFGFWKRVFCCKMRAGIYHMWELQFRKCCSKFIKGDS